MWIQDSYLLLRKSAIAKLGLVLSLITLIGLSTVQNYGISSDEATEIRMVQENIDWIATRDPIASDLAYYGTLFNGLAEGAFRVEETLRYGHVRYPLDCGDDLVCHRNSMQARIQVKHRVNFLFSLIGYGAIAGIVAIFCGWQSAWFAPIVLALIPGFWGHSFFNPKDSPFAALFTLCTMMGAYVVRDVLEAEHAKLGNNRLTKTVMGYGCLVGLLTSIRIGGFLLLGFVAIAYLTLRIVDLWQTHRDTLGRSLLHSIVTLMPFYGVMVASWLVTVVVLQPASWSNPLLWLYRAIKYLSNHGWSKYLLFNGEYVLAADAPRSYILTWIAITVPLVFLLAFGLGVVWLARRYPRLSTLQKACGLLVVLQIFLLPLIAIVKGSTVYDGIRQFLFVIPGIAAIAAIAIILAYQSLGGRYTQLAFATCLSLLLTPIVYDMSVLYPYEYAYFNRAFGGLPAAQGQFETDYWGLSVKEAVNWVNEQAAPNATLAVAVPFNTTLIVSDPDLNVVELEYDYQSFRLEDDPPLPDRPFYYLAIPKHKLNQVLTECDLAYAVERQGVPLTTVRYCQ